MVHPALFTEPDSQEIEQSHDVEPLLRIIPGSPTSSGQSSSPTHPADNRYQQSGAPLARGNTPCAEYCHRERSHEGQERTILFPGPVERLSAPTNPFDPDEHQF
jgi:hypothetical protein